MYANNPSWKVLQNFLPEKNRITERITPEEKYIKIIDMEIHLDEYNNNSDTSIIMFHGVGGNGRLLSFIAVPLFKAGYNVLCPDLPGYGYSRYNKLLTYSDWIDTGAAIVERELAKSKKVFVMGLSAGGMLAYNVVCKNQEVQGLIVTNLLDNREEEVRIHSAKNKLQAKYGIQLLNHFPGFLKTIKLPIRMVTNMNAIVNHKEVLKVILKDKLGAGNKVSLNFLLSMMNSIPLIEPEDFKKVPVLMVHPGNDLWTPVRISDLFFNRIASSKYRVILKNAGHFPVEEEALVQMEREIVHFIRSLLQK